MTAKCDFLSKRAIYRIAFFLSFWSVWSLTICNSFYLIWKYEKRFIEEKNFSKNFIKKKGVTQSNQLQGLPKVLCFCSCDQVQKFFFSKDVRRFVCSSCGRIFNVTKKGQFLQVRGKLHIICTWTWSLKILSSVVGLALRPKIIKKCLTQLYF